MKKTRTVIALAMAVALAAPAVTAPNSSAAAKAPKLTMKDGDAIITGKTKIYKIKNVKKANVKSLTVKVANDKVAKLKAKTKTAFTVEAVGGGTSEVIVNVKLKKAQAGKKAYKFDNVICCGSDETPQIRLKDSVTLGEKTALVLKAGSKADESKPDNALVADVTNLDAIGARNLNLYWFENGSEKDEWSRDAAGNPPHRPDAENVTPAQPATGSAAKLPATPSATTLNPSDGVPGKPSPMLLGLVQQSVYQVLAVNTLSGKATLSGTKIVRYIPDEFIQIAVKSFQEFVAKYPDSKAKEILTNDQKEMEYLFDFKEASHAIGICIGMTDGVIDDIAVRIHADGANATAINEMFQDRANKMSKVADYMGISQDLVKAFFRHLAYIANKSLTDDNFALKIFDFM